MPKFHISITIKNAFKAPFTMKKKKTIPVIQQPVIFAVLLIVVIASLWSLLMFIPGAKEGPGELIGTNDVRSGNQTVSVSLVAPGEETSDDYAADTSEGTPASGKQLVMESTMTGKTADMIVKSIPADENVKFRIDRFQKLAVQPLKFELFDENGTAMNPDLLKSIRGNKVHFYLVHANLNEYHHLFPEYSNNVWNVSVNMPTPGTYYAYIAAADLYGSIHVYRSDLIVRDESDDNTVRPDPTTNLEFFDGRRTAKLTMQKVDTGRLFALDLSRNGDVIVPQPYLESTGHLTLFKHGEPDIFVSTAANVVKSVEPNPVFFGTPSLTPGRYTAFAEIKLEGQVFVFPLTFDVGSL